MTKEKAIERAFNKANLQGESADVYAIIYGYKVLAALPETEIDTIYEAIVKRLGFWKPQTRHGGTKAERPKHEER